MQNCQKITRDNYKNCTIKLGKYKNRDAKILLWVLESARKVWQKSNRFAAGIFYIFTRKRCKLRLEQGNTTQKQSNATMNLFLILLIAMVIEAGSLKLIAVV